MIASVEDILIEVYKKLNVSSLKKLVANIYNSSIRPANSSLPAITMSGSSLPESGQQRFNDVYLIRVFVHVANNGGETMSNAITARIKKEISSRLNGRFSASRFTGDLIFEKNTIEDAGHVVNEVNPAETMHILQYRAKAYASA